MVVVVQQVKNKNKLYKYKVFVDYFSNKDFFNEFDIWAYTEAQALILVAITLNMPINKLKSITRITIYKQTIESFICRLFNKVPEAPVCTKV